MTTAIAPTAAPPTAVRLEIYRKDNSFHGDLIWSDGLTWVSWQASFRTIKALTESARCTFDGPIERV